jgi:uncharacterized protein YggT (Ycf19 family)
MRAILEIILMLLDLYWWIVLAMIIMSWLFSFNVINGRNEFVASVWRVLNALTEPVLAPHPPLHAKSWRLGPIAHRPICPHLLRQTGDRPLYLPQRFLGIFVSTPFHRHA